MRISTALLAVAFMADVESSQPEAPALGQNSTEANRLIGEAEAVLKTAKPMAMGTLEKCIARLRAQGIAVPDEVPTVYPKGEIDRVEGNSEHRVGEDVESKFFAEVQITEQTVNRFLIEATIRDSGGASANSAQVGERVPSLKPNIACSFTAKKPGKYERIFILSVPSLKDGESVVLDVAKQLYEVLPAE